MEWRRERDEIRFFTLRRVTRSAAWSNVRVDMSSTSLCKAGSSEGVVGDCEGDGGVGEDDAVAGAGGGGGGGGDPDGDDEVGVVAVASARTRTDAEALWTEILCVCIL